MWSAQKWEKEQQRAGAAGELEGKKGNTIKEFDGWLMT